MSAQFHPLVLPIQGSQILSSAELQRVDPDAAKENARFFAASATLDLRYAPVSWAEVFADLPYQADVQRVDVASAHHRSGTFQGLGDVRLGAHFYPLDSHRWTLGLIAGIALPTGLRHRLPGALAYVEENEAAKLGLSVPRHNHLQLGSGAVAPIAGTDLAVRVAPRWLLYASGEVTIPVSAASDGYLTAPSGLVELGPIFTVPSPRLLLGLFAEVYAAGIDHFDGQPIPWKTSTGQGSLPGRFRVPNTGRVALAVDPTVTWWATRALSVVLHLRVPVLTHADQFPVFAHASSGNVQLAEPVGIQLGVAYDFAVGRQR